MGLLFTFYFTRISLVYYIAITCYSLLDLKLESYEVLYSYSGYGDRVWCQY